MYDNLVSFVFPTICLILFSWMLLSNVDNQIPERNIPNITPNATVSPTAKPEEHEPENNNNDY